MTGERQGRVFQLADRVKVRVVAVNMEDRKNDFEIVE
jgi:exoribonuclease R